MLGEAKPLFDPQLFLARVPGVGVIVTLTVQFDKMRCAFV